MYITTILFDLDGTLLPMDQEKFTRRYFELLAEKMSAYGYEKNQLVDAVWKGTAAMVKNAGDTSNEEPFGVSLLRYTAKKRSQIKSFSMSFMRRSFREQEIFAAMIQK